jgi:hypothetical protein
MPITVDTVNSSDTLNQGRIKWNANDEALKDQGNALEEQQADHVIEGHPTLNYTKAEIDALDAIQDAALAEHTAGTETIIAGMIRGSGEGKALDGVTIGLNANNELEVIIAGVNVLTKKKIFLQFAYTLSGSTYTVKFAGVDGSISGHCEVGTPRAGAVTGISIISDTGASNSDVVDYASSGSTHFAALQQVGVYLYLSGSDPFYYTTIYATVGGVNVSSMHTSILTGAATKGWIILEIQLD